MPEERVQKIIANCGICSRRKAEELIEEGKVKVNSKVITIGDKSDLSKDKIEVNDQPIKRTRKVYYMFYKPKGYLTSLKDPSNLKTIFEIIFVKERIIPIGRLDYNTEGLLLLTNDGDFANKIMHPRYNIKKTYLATLDKQLQKEDAKKIEEGIVIENRKTKGKISILDMSAMIEIHEGRNRIVRKIFESLGYTIKNLKRTRIGRLGLGDLKPKQIRKMSPQEIKLLTENIKEFSD